jgi:hypothetical protein
LNSTVGSKKYNVNIELLSGLSQWRLTPGVNGYLHRYIYIINMFIFMSHRHRMKMFKVYYNHFFLSCII